MVQNTEIKDTTQILEAIESVKKELAATRMYGTKAAQRECFSRLINLYASLNISKLIEMTENFNKIA